MYISDIIKPLLNEELKKYSGKQIEFYDEENSGEYITRTVKSITFHTDDGDCWLEIISDKDEVFTVFGQGVDIYFEVKD